MRRFVLFIILGVLFASVGEYCFSVIIRHDLPGFLDAMVLNLIYLALVYFAGLFIQWACRGKAVSHLVYYLFFGFLGLMIEWFVIGNSPWQNPSASQIGMFAYWTTTVMAGRILTDTSPRLACLQKLMLAFFIPYALLGIVGGYLLPTPEVKFVVLVWLVIFGYVFLNIFHIWYIVHKFKSA